MINVYDDEEDIECNDWNGEKVVMTSILEKDIECNDWNGEKVVMTSILDSGIWWFRD